MQELVANYRAKVDEEFVEGADAFFTLATQNMIAAERHIADAIAEAEDAGELIPIRTALAISRDAADRFGYGKKTQNLNINVDFAAQLERAIAAQRQTDRGDAQRRRATNPSLTGPLAAASVASTPWPGYGSSASQPNPPPGLEETVAFEP